MYGLVLRDICTSEVNLRNKKDTNQLQTYTGILVNPLFEAKFQPIMPVYDNSIGVLI